MNVSDLIINTLREIEDGQTLISTILNKCLRIAVHLNDSKEIAWLTYNLNNYEELTNKSYLKAHIIDELVNSFGEEEAKTIWSSFIEEYIRTRSVEIIDIHNPSHPSKNVVVGLSVTAIENRILMLEDSIKNNTLPEGLNSLDLYFKLEDQQKVGYFFQNQLNQNRDILSKLKNRAYSKLVEYEKSILKSGKTEKIKVTNNKNIFIIHGHDEARWRELKSILTEDFALNPIILSEQPDKGKTIIEKFEHYAERCCYAFAIFTPDDIVENNGIKYFQARPNVIYELGWFTAYLGRNRVCILLQEGSKMDIFSDLAGVIQKRFYKNINEKFREIQLELKDCSII